jgi:hypothetical protein
MTSSGEGFLYLLFLLFLQLKIFNTPECHILEEHVLNPINVFGETFFSLSQRAEAEEKGHNFICALEKLRNLLCCRNPTHEWTHLEVC